MVASPIVSAGGASPQNDSESDATSNLTTDVLSASLYPELKRLARTRLRRERPDHTLQATALINELYLRLLRNPNFVWKDRNHFMLAASRAMRNVLVDHAREKASEKRGGGRIRVDLAEAGDAALHRPEQLLDIDTALQRLEQVEQRMARVVELRFFGQLTFSEIGEVLSINERTAKRDWALARTWLRATLGGSDSDERERVGED